MGEGAVDVLEDLLDKFCFLFFVDLEDLLVDAVVGQP